jgi:hypothetical protein
MQFRQKGRRKGGSDTRWLRVIFKPLPGADTNHGSVLPNDNRPAERSFDPSFHLVFSSIFPLNPEFIPGTPTVKKKGGPVNSCP